MGQRRGPGGTGPNPMNAASQPNIIPPDDSSIFTTLQNLQTFDSSFYNAVVRPNNPPLGIGGFLFDIPGDEQIRLRSQISNYFLEDNTTYQDNIAVEPAIITLHGMVAELVLGIPLNPPSPTSTTVNPLIPAMMPGMTPQQQQDYNQNQAQLALATNSGQAQAAANGTSQSLYQFYKTTSTTQDSQTRQTGAFLYFQQLQVGKQLCSVETPWGIYENCAILEVQAIQDERTKAVTEFTITFQTMRFAQDATVVSGNLAGRTSLQMATTTQDGNAGQTPTTQQAIQSAVENIEAGKSVN